MARRFDNYLKCEAWNIKNQTEADIAVLNYDDEILRNAAEGKNPVKAYFSIKENLMSVKDRKEMTLRQPSFVDKDKIIYFDREQNITEEITWIRVIGKHKRKP